MGGAAAQALGSVEAQPADTPPPPPAQPPAAEPGAGAPAPAETLMASNAPPPAEGAAPAAPEGPTASNPEDVTIYVVVGYFHSDVVIPRAAFARAPALLRAAADRAPPGDWIIVGWGPWWFGRDAKGTALRPPPIRMALGMWTLAVPQFRSQLRVAAVDTPGAPRGEHDMLTRPIHLSPDKLDRLMERIDRSFAAARDGGPIAENRKGVSEGIEIYRSKEIYHLTHQCNHWLGEVLRAGGANTSWIMDLLPASLYLDLKMSGALSAPENTAPPATKP